MAKLYFRNSLSWNKVHAVLGNDKILLTKRDADGDFVFEFNNEKYDSVYFENDLGEKTGVVYPGAFQ